ncbi:hypothetical protein CEXT_489421 [Caerostris extrusa]|uniref:Uncharacterized protein n=1 Tax=Caerostris extrusa TaxID=172846 RepID=A0AAV4QKL5_CAEEX|nr:hypothetical protein CEXT_489421 [Caerostris extrusa]
MWKQVARRRDHIHQFQKKTSEAESSLTDQNHVSISSDIWIKNLLLTIVFRTDPYMPHIGGRFQPKP